MLKFLTFQLMVDPVLELNHKHGQMIPENLIINANDWDGALKNVRDPAGKSPDPDKINLLKRIPDSDNVLVIGATRSNGFFMVTHYEVVPKSGNEIKSLLGRGDLLSSSGNALAPEVFLGAPSSPVVTSGSKGLLGSVDAIKQATTGSSKLQTGKTLTIKPATPEAKKGTATIKGKLVSTPTQRVSKADLKAMIKKN